VPKGVASHKERLFHSCRTQDPCVGLRSLKKRSTVCCKTAQASLGATDRTWHGEGGISVDWS